MRTQKTLLGAALIIAGGILFGFSQYIGLGDSETHQKIIFYIFMAASILLLLKTHRKYFVELKYKPLEESRKEIDKLHCNNTD